MNSRAPDSPVHRARRLLRREPRARLAQAFEELLGTSLRLVQRDERRGIADALLGEHVALLHEPGLDVLRRGHHARAREGARHVTGQERGQRVDHRREEDVELLPLAEHQLAVVAGDALDRVAAVHGAAPLAELAPLLLGGVGGEDEPRPSTPSAPKKPTQNWWVDQRFRTRGMPTRRLARDGGGLGAGAAERVRPNHLGNVRVLTLDLLELGLDPRISLTSSTSPLGQELPLMTRSQPGASGSLLHARPAAPGSCTSMKVRVQLTGHHLQTVSALVVLV